MHEFWGIGDEMLKFAVDGVDGEDRVLANVRVSVLEAGTAGRDERF